MSAYILCVVVKVRRRSPIPHRRIGAVYKIIGRIRGEVLRALERGVHTGRLYYYSFHYNASARFDERRSDPRKVRVRVAGSRLVHQGGPESRPGLPRLFRRVTVVALLVATIGLLALKTDLHIRIQVAKSSSGTGAPEKREQIGDENPIYRETSRVDEVAPVATRAYEATEQARTPAPMQVSHLQVTDNNARNVLLALSQYELVGLRRRALYGDESAAFLMGMAYEIGHGVRQDCKTAAQWVSNAAAEGNVVAQYNLGLRYRDGDGVPMNTEAAMKWLQKAAGHQVPGAQMALIAVTSRQGRVAASRQ
jgi:hypothetical protein